MEETQLFKLNVYRRKFILFEIASIIYGFVAFVASSLMFAYRHFDFFSLIITVLFYIPYLLISFEVFGKNNNLKHIYKISPERKTVDIIHVLLIIIFLIPCVFSVLLQIILATEGFYNTLKLFV